MSLDTFIATGRKSYANHREHVRHPKFSTLYLRYSKKRMVSGTRYYSVLDIASVEARKKGEGSFRRLVERIKKNYPDLHIFVENVLTPQFQRGLARMGFEEVLDSGFDNLGVKSYFLRSDRELIRPKE